MQGLSNLISILFWIFVAVLVVKIYKNRKRLNLTKSLDKVVGSSSAIDILNERYARGEIGKDEYEQKKEDIAG